MLVLLFHALQPLDRIRLRLAIDQLVMQVAEEDKVRVAVALLERDRRVTSRPLRTRSDNVGDFAKNHGPVRWAVRSSEDSTAIGKGAAVSRLLEQDALLAERYCHLSNPHLNCTNPSVCGANRQQAARASPR